MGRVIIEFTGGFRDGLRLVSDSLDAEESQWAWMWYRQFKDGKVGHTITSMSDAALEWSRQYTVEERQNLPGPPGHYYQVADRIEDGDTVTVKIKHISREEYERGKKRGS